MYKLIIFSFFLTFTALLFSACTKHGDFGRVNESKLKLRYNDIVGAIQRETGMLSQRSPYLIPLTKHERTLRQTLSWYKSPLLRNAKFRHRSKSTNFTRHKVQYSLTEHLLSKIKSDLKYLSYFNKAGKNVIDQDRQRYEVIAGAHRITRNDSRYILVRIHENRAVMMNTMKSLNNRIAKYDEIIENSRVHLPNEDGNKLQIPLDRLRSAAALTKTKFESYMTGRSEKVELYFEDEN